MNPKFSIIVPAHREQFLSECIDSVLAQTFTDWELIIVPNGGVKLPPIPLDRRIRVVDGQHLSPAIGPIKNFAFKLGTGDYLVELDSDDLLLPHALSELSEAISSHPSDFYYSNAAYFQDDFRAVTPFSEETGNQHRLFNYENHQLYENVAFDMVPHNIQHVHGAPDHIRVWSRDFYHRIGGHDANTYTDINLVSQQLDILDDVDLLCRTYLEGSTYHINKCLYLYRYGNNTWSQRLGRRQQLDGTMRVRWLDKMMREWAEKNHLVVLDSLAAIKDVESVCDNSIGYIKSSEELHRVLDPIQFANFLYRKMAPGGFASLCVIHGACDGFIADPSATSSWCLKSFDYWTDKKRADSIGSKVRWRTIRGWEWEETPGYKYAKWEGYALKGGSEEAWLGWKGI